MDLSDLTRVPVPAAGGPALAGAATYELAAQIGAEVAGVLTQALERVNALAATGRIDQAGLRALRDNVDLARRIGIMGQQIGRLAGGRMQLARERLGLANLLRETLRLRGREIEARGLEIRQVLAPAEVMSDATLLFSLLQAVLDWSFEHAVARIDLTVQMRSWPACARLTCRLRHRPIDEVDADLPGAEPEARLDTMSWRLLQQTALALGLHIERQDAPGDTTLTVDFPDTPAAHIDGPGGPPPADTAFDAAHSMTLAGRHVLVVAARREMRTLVRDALRPLGMTVDYVSSADEAAEFCRTTVPHAVVYDAALAGARLERLRQDALATAPKPAFVELATDGQGFEMLNAGGRPFARVGHDDIAVSLPAALGHELTRLGGL